MSQLAELSPVRTICETYRMGTPARRQVLRLLYPRLRLEFDAIDFAEDRARRIAAAAVRTRSEAPQVS